ARALLARRVFQERGVDLHREVVGQQLGEDLLFRRLEFVDRRDAVGGRLLLGNLRRRERDQLLHRDDLGDRRAEAVEDDRADIKFAGFEQRQHPAGDVTRFLERYAAAADIGQAVVNQPRVVAAQAVAPLAADRQGLDALAG